MNYHIEQNGFRAEVSSDGAELKSFKNLTTNQEYIWEGNPDYWGSSAPILFPIVGMLKGGIFKHDSKSYELKRHGLARNLPFKTIKYTSDQIQLRLESDENTKRYYPFDFELTVHVEIRSKALRCSYTVKNTGNQTMPFGLGSHPAFALDLSASTLEDYYIEFDQAETLDLFLLDAGLIEEAPTKAFLKNEQRFRLSDTIFDQDALIFKNIHSQKISIGHSKNGILLSLDRGNCPHLGIWSKPRAPFVCIEPWHSYSDNSSHNQVLSDKEAILVLEPGKSFDSDYTIEIA